MSPVLFALLLGTSAFAQDPEDEFDFIKPDDAVEEDKVESGDFNLFEEEDDFDIAPPAAKPPPPLPGLPEASGAPLTGGQAGQVVAGGGGSTVVELPVHVSNGGDLGGGFWLQATAWSGDTQVGESWQQVSAASMPAGGPGFVFVKMQVPVEGDVELRVARASEVGGDGEELFRKIISR